MKRGFATITVVFLIVGFALLAGAALAVLAGFSDMMADEYRSQQAFHVADAGISDTAQQLVDDTDWSDNTGFTKSFGPGSFTISYVAQTQTTATIRSDGTVGGITRSIQQSLTKGGDPVAFDHVFYTESYISAGGSSTGTVNGDMQAGGTIETTGVVFNGDQDASNPASDVPTPDWSYWLGVATTTVSGNQNFSSGTYSGIYYVSGNVGIQSDVTINGTIVARGKISISSGSNVTITATDPNPALISENFESFTGGGNITINGWCVTLGTFSVNGTAPFTLNGGVAAVGNIGIGGNADLAINYVAPGSTVPGFIGGETEGAIISGTWEEMH